MLIQWVGISSWRDRMSDRLLPVQQRLLSKYCRNFFSTFLQPSEFRDFWTRCTLQTGNDPITPASFASFGPLFFKLPATDLQNFKINEHPIVDAAVTSPSNERDTNGAAFDLTKCILLPKCGEKGSIKEKVMSYRDQSCVTFSAECNRPFPFIMRRMHQSTLR